VLFQCDNYGFSDPVVFRSKAQCRRPMVIPLASTGTQLRHHRVALWVSLSTPTDCVAPLGKGHCLQRLAITCEARLAMSIDKLTELAIITLKEH